MTGENTTQTALVLRETPQRQHNEYSNDREFIVSFFDRMRSEEIAFIGNSVAFHMGGSHVRNLFLLLPSFPQ
jgi:hypothetical protein